MLAYRTTDITSFLSAGAPSGRRRSSRTRSFAQLFARPGHAVSDGSALDRRRTGNEDAENRGP
jgi:hypothetical protein